MPQGGKALAEIRPLLGPAWIIEGEDPETYERLLADVGHAIGPRDLIDWILVKDVVALTWEIQRTRRLRSSLLRSARKHAIASLLFPQLPRPEFQIGVSPSAELAANWELGEPAATKRVNSLLKNANLTFADVDALVLSQQVKDFDRIDAHAERCEDRRDKLLRQIERRHAGTAKGIVDASEDIIEAEYVANPPRGSTVGEGGA